MRRFFDANTEDIITEQDLKIEFEEKLSEDISGEYDGWDFDDYIKSCTSKHGTLEEL